MTKLQCSPRNTQLHVAGSLAHDARRAALNLQHFTNRLHLKKCNHMHPSDWLQAAYGCMHVAATCIQASCSMLNPAYRRNAACMQASYTRMQPAYDYERMKAAYDRTAAFMQGCMQPACLLSVNPA